MSIPYTLPTYRDVEPSSVEVRDDAAGVVFLLGGPLACPPRHAAAVGSVRAPSPPPPVPRPPAIVPTRVRIHIPLLLLLLPLLPLLLLLQQLQLLRLLERG